MIHKYYVRVKRIDDVLPHKPQHEKGMYRVGDLNGICTAPNYTQIKEECSEVGPSGLNLPNPKRP